jgi:hypothetical protein
MYWVVEAKTAIPLRCLLYTGKDTLSAASLEQYGGHVPALVMELTEPFLDSGRNVTADNYFTSHKLAMKLEARRTTLVGTLRNNSTCLPQEAKLIEGRQRGESVHYYSGAATICSYWDKGKKPVCLLSTMHGNLPNRKAGEGKSDIVEEYNATKSGVDTLDKIVRGYSSKRKYRRWPPHVYFTLLDCSVYVAFHMRRNDSSDDHYTFKKELAYEMALPLVRKRAQLQSLRSGVATAMKMMGVFPPLATLQKPCGTSRCAYCPRKKDRKSKTQCASCPKFICADHQFPVCSECLSRTVST